MGYEFQANVQYLDRETAIIHLDGDLTCFAAKAIYDAYSRVSGQEVNHVILHLTPNSTIHNPSMVIFIDLIVQAAQRGQRLLILLPNIYHQRIFNLIGLNKQVGIYNSLEEVLAQLRCPQPAVQEAPPMIEV